jgi:hypothetical protein
VNDDDYNHANSKDTEALKLVLVKDSNATGWALGAVRLKEDVSKQVVRLVEAFNELGPIEDDKSLCNYIEWMGEAKAITGGIEAARVQVGRPFLDATKLINSAAKLASLDLDNAIAAASRMMAQFDGVRKREQEEEERKGRETAKAATLASIKEEEPERKEHLMQVASDAMAIAHTAVKKVPGLTTRLDWEPSINDLLTVVKTNPHLLRVEVNKSALNDMLRSLKYQDIEIKPDTIPGITLVPTSGASVSRKGARRW